MTNGYESSFILNPLGLSDFNSGKHNFPTHAALVSTNSKSTSNFTGIGAIASVGGSSNESNTDGTRPAMLPISSLLRQHALAMRQQKHIQHRHHQSHHHNHNYHHNHQPRLNSQGSKTLSNSNVSNLRSFSVKRPSYIYLNYIH